MSNKKKSVTVLQIAAVSMIAVGAYAAIPGAVSTVPSIQAESQAPDGEANRTKPRGIQIAMVQYGPEPVQFDPIPLGEAQDAVPTPKGPLAAWKTNPLTTYASTAPLKGQPTAVDGAPAPISVSQVSPEGGLLDDMDCRFDRNGRRAPIPLDRLVELIQEGVRAYGQSAISAQIRILVQADLNRSGDNAVVKTKAVERLSTALASDSAAREALAKPFDLNDGGMVYANGYDPCGNPAAIGGGSGFGQGPFAGDFQTINPVPVVATKLAETAEGGSGT